MAIVLASQNDLAGERVSTERQRTSTSMMPGRGGDAVRGVEVASLFGWLMSYHRREQLVSA